MFLALLKLYGNRICATCQKTPDIHVNVIYTGILNTHYMIHLDTMHVHMSIQHM